MSALRNPRFSPGPRERNALPRSDAMGTGSFEATRKGPRREHAATEKICERFVSLPGEMRPIAMKLG